MFVEKPHELNLKICKRKSKANLQIFFDLVSKAYKQYVDYCQK